MRAFIFIWVGQLVSLLGTGMSRFALTIWAFQITGEATALALVGFFSFAPSIVISPIAGALVDRWNRKLVMILSDLAAGLMTIVVLLLYVTGNLEIWHLYVTGFIAAIFEPFQWPAFSAAMSTMVPKEQYGRANGLVSLADSVSTIAAPLMAGALLVAIGLGGILAIDIVTFLFAIGSILLVKIPQPARSAEGEASRGSLWQDSIYGFRYIWRRKSLLGIQFTFTISNFFGSMAMILVAPMILARTGNNSLMLGTVQSAMGVGGVVGGLAMSLWGGPKPRIHGVLAGFILFGIFGDALMGIGQTIQVWVAAGFIGLLILPFINGSNQSIWQAKVPPDLQGRVFATRRLIAQIAGPIGLLLAGPLADRVFEPAMQPGGALAESWGWLVGVGPGAGMGLLIVVTGLLAALAGVVGYVIPQIRNAERLMSDHDAAAPAATVST
jgi:DHA3 family macrolide efflux protein-like MFS transporter